MKKIIAFGMSAVFVLILFACKPEEQSNDKDIAFPSHEQILKQFQLENATEKTYMEKMESITLFKDGTALLSQPPISSSHIPRCRYSEKDGKLLIHYPDDVIIATFVYIDENTIVLQSSARALFAGICYVQVPNEPALFDEEEEKQ